MKYFIIMLLCVVMTLSVACAELSNDKFSESEGVLNDNQKESNEKVAEEKLVEESTKFIGSKEVVFATLHSESLYFKSFEDFVNYEYVDKIAIGKIDSVKEVFTDYIGGETALEDWIKTYSDTEQWKEEDFPHEPPTYTETYYNVSVDKTLFGEESSSLLLCLSGTPDSHSQITKPDIGDEVVLFLWKNGGGSYTPTAYEQSIFRINKDKTVYSFSDEEVTAQFDGKPFEVLIEEINKSLNLKN